LALVERALSSRRFGYSLQAAIGPCMPGAERGGDPTGRRRGLYDALARADPSPVIELNRPRAVAMRDCPAAGLALVDAILAAAISADYHLAHSAHADLCRRLGRTAEARASYERALALTGRTGGRVSLSVRLEGLRD